MEMPEVRRITDLELEALDAGSVVFGEILDYPV